MESAITGDNVSLENTFSIIVDNYMDYIGPVVYYWCTMYSDHVADGVNIDSGNTKFTGLSFIDANCKSNRLRCAGSPAVPREVVWAGRLVTARTLNDEDQYNALIRTLPDDSDEIIDHIWVLVTSIGITIANTPRGFGLTRSQ